MAAEDYNALAALVRFRPLDSPLRPDGHPTHSPFKAPWPSTVRLLTRELNLHGAKATVMEMDFRESDLRLDGLPRSDRNARSAGIRLSFTATHVSGKPDLRYEVTTYIDWRDNVRGVALALEALRAVDRYGVTRRGEQYAGWRQLGTGSESRGRELIKEHGGVREALFATHPDQGGDPADFGAVMAAKNAAVVL